MPCSVQNTTCSAGTSFQTYLSVKFKLINHPTRTFQSSLRKATRMATSLVNIINTCHQCHIIYKCGNDSYSPHLTWWEPAGIACGPEHPNWALWQQISLDNQLKPYSPGSPQILCLWQKSQWERKALFVWSDWMKNNIIELWSSADITSHWEKERKEHCLSKNQLQSNLLQEGNEVESHNDI